jgi:sialate O-acetylesterase
MKSRGVLLTVVAAFLLLSRDCVVLAQGPFPAPPPLTPFPFVSPLFGDGMVLQRDKYDTIWGWSEQPGDKVSVQIGDTIETGIAQADRRWQVKIKPPAAGGP